MSERDKYEADYIQTSLIYAKIIVTIKKSPPTWYPPKV
jgi:hypothetical protein